MTLFHSFLAGALTMAMGAVGLIFLRYWRDSRDRLFLFFALSFFVQALNRLALVFSANPQEASPWHYGVRLIAYILIVLAIIDKNRPSRPGPASLPPRHAEEEMQPRRSGP